MNAISETELDGIYGELATKPHEVLIRVQENGRNLLALINDVLDLAKIEAGLVTLNPGPYSIGIAPDRGQCLLVACLSGRSQSAARVQMENLDAN